jgi:hypothetical protein
VALSSGQRKVALTAHVTASVGWLGAVAGFLALAVIALASDDAQTVRSAHVVMEPLGWFVLVPLAVASLLTGLIQSFGSVWGLFRHYWVVFKLLINVFATLVLLLYMQTLDHFAGIATKTPFSSADLNALRDPSPLLHSVLALLLLLVATTLAVFKPRGLTPYGRRQRS